MENREVKEIVECRNYLKAKIEHSFELLDLELKGVRQFREKHRSDKDIEFLEDRLGNWCQILLNMKTLIEMGSMISLCNNCKLKDLKDGCR